MDAIERASEVLGSQAALAKAVGVSPMAVTQWKARGVPPERCMDIETATGGKVTREELRPDIFGKATQPPETSPSAATN